MGILTGYQKKQPLHYGEVYGMWSYLMAAQGFHSMLQTYSNHTGDKDLKKLIEELIQGVKTEIDEVQEVLKENGVGLPPAPAEKPLASLEDIPTGAKIADPEISASISKDLGEGLIACTTIVTQSTRDDIAMLFGQYHMNKAQVAAKALRLNKEKGWLITPPLHSKVPHHD
ncbi:DUF3231 family protein [Aquisalibacillus elongatus]|uniref:Uncharacterized protein DUF3231 n=1 Tax=Aquisalibacillus elongatus TaxID=485577 RepID=A0A3N5B7B9_9BACI|nr:DUF3231 family protein [Aquisalibacillus elongatus]RPF53197.1 uncharacterized protein DUF3231 [Aquisalibacillus elongatus]